MFLSARLDKCHDHSDPSDGLAKATGEEKDIATCELWKVSEDDGIRVTEPLNKAARNEVVRNNPEIATVAIESLRLSLANRQGFFKKGDFVVSWEAAFIPYHLRFTVKCPKGEVEHFASVTDRAIRDPVQYAKDLIKLGDAYLANPQGSHQPHIPFARLPITSTTSPNMVIEEERTVQTMEHARWITIRHKRLADMDIESAEATAKLLNAGKISAGLLHYMITGEDVLLEISISKKSSRPLKKANRKMNNKRNELQGLIKPAPNPNISPEKPVSQARFLDQEIKDIRKDTLYELGEVAIEEDLVVEAGLSNKSGGTHSNLQSNKSKKKNSRRKPDPSRLANTDRSKPRQTQCNGQHGIAGSIQVDTLEDSPQSREAASPQASAQEEHRQSGCPENCDKASGPDLSAQEEPLPSGQSAKEIAFTNATADGESHHQISVPSELAPTAGLTKMSISAANTLTQKESHHHEKCELEQDLLPLPVFPEAPESEYKTASDHLDASYYNIENRLQHYPDFAIQGMPINDRSPSDSGYSSPSTDFDYDLPIDLPGLQWAYITRELSDETLNEAGVWQWEKPITHYQQASELAFESVYVDEVFARAVDLDRSCAIAAFSIKWTTSTSTGKNVVTET
ncbi:hypothetical protein P7C71_g6228, partial [Lecanoromycetidae sp. Uapishka_2]